MHLEDSNPLSGIDSQQMSDEYEVKKLKMMSSSLENFSTMEISIQSKSKSKIFGGESDNEKECEKGAIIESQERKDNSDAYSGLLHNQKKQGGVHDEEEQIYYDDESDEGQSKRSSEEELERSSSGEKPKNKGSGKGKEKNKPIRKNQYKTKNLLAFFWTKITNLFQSRPAIKRMKEWKDLKVQKASLETFNSLFKSEFAQQILTSVFQSYYFARIIVQSSIKPNRKKLYMKYIKTIERGFQNKNLQYLN